MKASIKVILHGRSYLYARYARTYLKKLSVKIAIMKQDKKVNNEK